MMRNKVNVFLAVIIYTAGFLIGNYFSKFEEYVIETSSNQSFLPSSEIHFNFIFQKNLRVIVTLLLGGFVFGIPTFLNLISNGYIFGVIFGVYSKIFKINQILLLTLPHGFLEIPAIIIAGAAGFKIPYEVVRYLLGRKEQVLTKEDIEEYLTLALVSIILIVIAAWIEANVTLKIAKAMLSTGI